MRSVWLYRVAAILFLLFAIGHTFGFLSFQAPTRQGRAVFDAMNAVRFTAGGASLSYGNFYRGFGLFITANMLFSAFLAWHLSRMAHTSPNAIGALGWAFFLVQPIGLVLSWMFFAAAQVLFSAALAILLGGAMLALPRAAR